MLPKKLVTVAMNMLRFSDVVSIREISMEAIYWLTTDQPYRSDFHDVVTNSNASRFHIEDDDGFTSVGVDDSSQGIVFGKRLRGSHIGKAEATLLAFTVDSSKRLKADASRRRQHQSLECTRIKGIHNEAQASQCVLNLLAEEKTDTDRQ